MAFLRRFLSVLKDYCINSSVAGLSYIADSRYHYTERWFWVACLVFSTFGSYLFVMDTLRDFEEAKISMVVESLQPLDKTNFPTIAVCEMGYTKDDYDFINDLAEEVAEGSDDDEIFGDVYDFLMRIVYFNLYAINTYQSYCKKYDEASGEASCPQDDYLNISRMTVASCPELFIECRWMGKPFDCCEYFIPLNTTYGRCYMLNSIQATTKNGPKWMDLSMNSATGPGEIEMMFHKSARVCLLNEEDVPNLLLSNLHLELRNIDSNLFVAFSLQNVLNDDGVRYIDKDNRKCKFPEEDPESKYKYYSFTTCVAECIKSAQLRACGCVFHYMIYDDDDDTPVCDYPGLVCLDTKELIFPRATMLQPWSDAGDYHCDCYPSCSDHEIKVVAELNSKHETRKITLKLIGMPTQRYRRQHVKDSLDLVVALGGILSLFLGASILSLVEFIYFFSVRLIGTAWINRQTRKQLQKLDRKPVKR